MSLDRHSETAVGMSGSIGIVPGGYFAGLLGSGPEVRCKVVNADISVHWFPTAARPGTPCLCGATAMRDPAESDERRRCPACSESASGLCSWHRDYGPDSTSPSQRAASPRKDRD